MREYADRGPSGTDNRFYGFVFSGRRATAGTSTARRSRTRRTELGPDAHKALARQMRDYFLGQTHWPPLASGIRDRGLPAWLRRFRFGGPNASSSH